MTLRKSTQELSIHDISKIKKYIFLEKLSLFSVFIVSQLIFSAMIYVVINVPWIDENFYNLFVIPKEAYYFGMITFWLGFMLLSLYAILKYKKNPFLQDFNENTKTVLISTVKNKYIFNKICYLNIRGKSSIEVPKKIYDKYHKDDFIEIHVLPNSKLIVFYDKDNT